MSKYTEMAERLEKFWPNTLEIAEAAALLREADNLLSACEPYLKDGETPAERIERERRDTAYCHEKWAETLKRVEELEAALRRPEFHREFANDNGVCATVCPVCAALDKREDSRE